MRGAAVLLLIGALACSGRQTIVIGAKNFTEQAVVGEILATLIEDRTRLEVDRRFDLGGTFVCHRALAAGEIDLYVEYTGTALTAILKEPPMSEPGPAYERVSQEYFRRYAAIWMPPLGFDNSFALVVRREDASRLGLARISDLSRVRESFRAGFGYEFLERPDGWRGLARAYGFDFARPPREMDLGLLYRALGQAEIDVAAGNSTDGLIAAMDLVVLEDDRSYFPPYQAAPVVRQAALARHRDLRAVLELLADRISAEEMRRMNQAADGDRRSPRSIAAEFLAQEGLLIR